MNDDSIIWTFGETWWQRSGARLRMLRRRANRWLAQWEA